MNYKQLICLLGLCILAENVWAYGSSSSKKACNKPKFSQFSPPDKATAAAGSEFAFTASPNTQPGTIKVRIKDLPVAINIRQTPQGYQIQGKLPESLKGTYARITVSGEGLNQCKGDGGWLVNIAE